MEVLSFVLNALGLGCAVLATIIKGEKMKQVLALVFMANLLVGTSYLFMGDGINGVVSNYIATVQTVISYMYESKGKTVPKWIVGLYALSFVAVNVIFDVMLHKLSIFTVLAIIACMTFILGILQKNGKEVQYAVIEKDRADYQVVKKA